ncbi:spore germination protein GerW family protein [Nocardia sp. NPDC050406]|uniref:spore germination protein GerW family protein n=1 Tax=Nocardia sp. NPDC050406 TaxID=3364318 RepID=UPI00379C646D
MGTLEDFDKRRSTADAAANLLERLTDRLGGRASVATVFGEPISREGVTVIPVARVGFGFGGGTGADLGEESVSGGGGGAGGVGVQPLGYIEIANGTTRYRAIHSHWLDILVPLAAVVTAAGVGGIARALLTRRKH